MSTAVGGAADCNCICQQLVPENNAKLFYILSWFTDCLLLLIQHWGFLVVVLNLYLSWTITSRFHRLRAIKKKYNFNKDPRTYEDMTVDVAQQIEKNLSEWEMPWLFEFGWLFNFLASASIPILSKTIIQSGHYTHRDPIIAQQRQEDTVILMSSMMAHPLRSRSSSLVIARINEHHSFYGRQINSDTVLYLIWLFGWGPVEMVQKFGWRKLQPFELHAMWIFWRELALRLGCKYVPETVEEMVAWKEAFRKQEVYPHNDNRIFADSMKDMLLYKVPGFAKGFAFQCILALLDDEVATACRWDGLKQEYHPTLRYWIHRLLHVRAFVHRYLTPPRRHPYVRTSYLKNEWGLYNFDATTYSTCPFYVKATFWSRWGPGALLNRARGFALPGPQYFSDGVAWESMGARRNKSKQRAAEARVIAQANFLEKAHYGYRALVNFQPEPVVRGLSLGYGDRANAYGRRHTMPEAA
ncbi:hypothetical protein FGG08_006730 [Glutinoglossum americanum]|uniref:ER-bound oxygenase mpaB/mpaB'/Rubber oxygenase catalytic domain-containing protein n=1 Tax=Glutinoglossum americanum TaxID=1670608 RepID=A0A9P8I4Q6_9PEZI|nr:hypothetical protein FGG08_006730 [Glutinoglossum americanum]